jgi:bZIP transcription factor
MAHRVLILAQRRRAQNRASQRAFRERKERHVKNLEQQLEVLHQQYEELLQAYDAQKEDIATLKADLHELHSESGSLQVPQNSPLGFASAVGAEGFQSESDLLQFRQNGLLIPQSQSMTPASNFDNQNFSSRASTCENQTPFGSLLPLTPAENFENQPMFRPSDLFFASREGSRCYSVGDCPDVQQQESVLSSPVFTKEFALNPTADMFEGWRWE